MARLRAELMPEDISNDKKGKIQDRALTSITLLNSSVSADGKSSG